MNIKFKPNLVILKRHIFPSPSLFNLVYCYFINIISVFIMYGSKFNDKCADHIIELSYFG